MTKEEYNKFFYLNFKSEAIRGEILNRISILREGIDEGGSKKEEIDFLNTLIGVFDMKDEDIREAGKHFRKQINKIMLTGKQQTTVEELIKEIESHYVRYVFPGLKDNIEQNKRNWINAKNNLLRFLDDEGS
ncbi:MAG: hypothetical protein AABY22_21925 [Nanoarchaeota archaeon]